ncbi:MAG: hypothetical protein ACPGXL_07365 [Chitinophagales bacterium]
MKQILWSFGLFAFVLLLNSCDGAQNGATMEADYQAEIDAAVNEEISAVREKLLADCNEQIAAAVDARVDSMQGIVASTPAPKPRSGSSSKPKNTVISTPAPTPPPPAPTTTTTYTPPKSNTEKVKDLKGNASGQVQTSGTTTKDKLKNLKGNSSGEVKPKGNSTKDKLKSLKGGGK